MEKMYNEIRSKKMEEKVIVFPEEVFKTAESKEELEDYLLTQNPNFIKKMRKIRKDDLQNKGRNWEVIKKELCIK